ncbi:hypothetical protein [Microbulbifer sp. A4B17]|uniref:hypothetical protein n=1 Tax=Microbulbifer sp. A4B17 TaxID=359370 RepID=UPI00186478A5|nr:hypothetical protein [Microbulbifer sp. A4B17]
MGSTVIRLNLILRKTHQNTSAPHSTSPLLLKILRQTLLLTALTSISIQAATITIVLKIQAQKISPHLK